MKIPMEVEEILYRLNDAGYEAFIVGGCVRDYLLMKEPNDWDITTSATPMQVKEVFRRTIDTGILHGTVTVMKNGIGYEITTYRIDGVYEDSRHPKDVTFTSNLEEDLKRRDFTINAMAYHPKEGLVDLFHGKEDLENGIVRCVGNPEERFSEDALRMMRGIRFAAQLGYKIEENTLAAIRKLAPTIQNISVERIQMEMTKLLVSDHPEYFRLFYDCGLTAWFLPEFDKTMGTTQNNPHHSYTVGEHTLHSLGEIKPEKELRLAMLLHDIAKPLMKTTDEKGVDHFKNHPAVGSRMAADILRRLHFDNHTIAMVKGFVEYHDWRMEPTEKSVRRVIHKVGEQYFPELFDIWHADIKAQSDYKREDKLELERQCRAIYRQIMDAGQCVSLSTLSVKGADLIQEGMAPGKQIGVVLNLMLQDVIEDPTHNNKEYLLKTYRKDFS